MEQQERGTAEQTAPQASAQEEAAKGKKRGDIIAMVVMIVLCVILVPIFVINLTLIIKGSINRDVPPDVFGVAPLAVVSPSMNGVREDCFDEGALIFVKMLSEEEKQELEVGDIVTFRAADGAFVTHRIISMTKNDAGVIEEVRTQGDANLVTDGDTEIANVLGICTGSVAGLGDFAMFLQTPVGILVFVGVPVLIFIAYDVTRIMLYNRRLRLEAAKSGEDTASASELESARSEMRSMDEELKRLRALVEAQAAASGQPAAETHASEEAAPADAAPAHGAEPAQPAAAEEESDKT